MNELKCLWSDDLGGLLVSPLYLYTSYSVKISRNVLNSNMQVCYILGSFIELRMSRFIGSVQYEISYTQHCIVVRFILYMWAQSAHVPEPLNPRRRLHLLQEISVLQTTAVGNRRRYHARSMVLEVVGYRNLTVSGTALLISR